MCPLQWNQGWKGYDQAAHLVDGGLATSMSKWDSAGWVGVDDSCMVGAAGEDDTQKAPADRGAESAH